MKMELAKRGTGRRARGRAGSALAALWWALAAPAVMLGTAMAAAAALRALG